MRHEHTAALPRWLALVCVLALLLSGCVSADDSEEGGEQTADDVGGNDNDSSGEGPLGSTIGTSTEGGVDLVIDITNLQRTTQEFIFLEFEIRNESGSSFQLLQGLSGNATESTAHGVNLIDTTEMKRYFPLETSDGTCFCHNWSGDEQIGSGEILSTWVAYPLPPEDTDAMTVEIPISPPVIDIPINDDAPTNPPEKPSDLTDPSTLDIYSFADDLGDGTGRSESEDETAIMLSTDVLFDTGESALTEDAEEVLEEAAAEIDDATGELVQVEGHADDTGSDSVNEPLSLERAESVQERLEDLVGRSEVSYESEGLGSADPIADNDTEDGREKNRRVTVTFAK